MPRLESLLFKVSLVGRACAPASVIYPATFSAILTHAPKNTSGVVACIPERLPNSQHRTREYWENQSSAVVFGPKPAPDSPPVKQKKVGGKCWPEFMCRVRVRVFQERIIQNKNYYYYFFIQTLISSEKMFFFWRRSFGSSNLSCELNQIPELSVIKTFFYTNISASIKRLSEAKH